VISVSLLAHVQPNPVRGLRIRGHRRRRWRRLERRFEDKHTAELTSDFDDYNIDDDSTAVRKMTNSNNPG